MPAEHALMELDILEDIPAIIGVLEEVLSDFGAWVHSVLDYEGSEIFNGYVTFNIPDINEQCMYRDSHFYFHFITNHCYNFVYINIYMWTMHVHRQLLLL